MDAYQIGSRITDLARRFGINSHTVTAILDREGVAEYFPLASGSGSVAESYQVTLGSSRFGPFLGVNDAADYLERVAVLSETAGNSAPLPVALPLIQTIDYLSFVLSADPGWHPNERLITAPDLESSAALGLPAENEPEFRSRMAAFWNIIDHFKVPEPSDPTAKRYFGSVESAQGSMNRLDIWLRERLGNERYMAAAADAVVTIRNIRHLRNEGSHPDPVARAKAIKARRSLGLPDVVADWSGAWERLKALAAGAFDILRQEVATAPIGNP